MRTVITKVGQIIQAAGKAANTWLQQRLCSLHGHDALLTLDAGRVFLRCTSCGHETPGWDLVTDMKPPKPVQPGIPRRHQIRRPLVTGIDWAGGPDRTVEVLRKGKKTLAIRRRRVAG